MQKESISAPMQKIRDLIMILCEWKKILDSSEHDLCHSGEPLICIVLSETPLQSLVVVQNVLRLKSCASLILSDDFRDVNTKFTIWQQILNFSLDTQRKMEFARKTTKTGFLLEIVTQWLFNFFTQEVMQDPCYTVRY